MSETTKEKLCKILSHVRSCDIYGNPSGYRSTKDEPFIKNTADEILDLVRSECVLHVDANAVVKKWNELSCRSTTDKQDKQDFADWFNSQFTKRESIEFPLREVIAKRDKWISELELQLAPARTAETSVIENVPAMLTAAEDEVYELLRKLDDAFPNDSPFGCSLFASHHYDIRGRNLSVVHTGQGGLDSVADALRNLIANRKPKKPTDDEVIAVARYDSEHTHVKSIKPLIELAERQAAELKKLRGEK